MEFERQNIFKGQTEEEIKTAFNNKWLEIIKNCTYKKRDETSANGLQQSAKNDIIIVTTNQLVSANLEKEELNKL